MRLEIALLLLATVLLSYWLTARIRQRALTRGILDIPNERSSHVVPTPRGGGMSIVVIFLLATLVLRLYGIIEWNLVLAFWVGGAVAVIGYLDDLHQVRPLYRAAVHFGAALLAVVLLGGVPPLNLGFTVWNWGWLGNIVGVVGIVWMINLYNFMDGIDGIAGSEAIFVCVVVAVLLLMSGNSAFAILLGVFVAAVAGFLVLNFPPAKIFMGDIGSGFLGYTLAILAIASAQTGFSLWAWLILLGVFIVDTLITLVRRVLRREKWYLAHRSHAYQHATTHFGSHLRVLSLIWLINLIWLTPLAVTVIYWPAGTLLITILSYIPLVILAFYFGAGVEKKLDAAPSSQSAVG